MLLAELDVAEDLVELLLRDLRALLGGGVEGVADLALLGLLGEPLDEFLVNLFLHEEPATRGAALATVEVDGVKGAGDGRLQVRVGEDDVGALAAELERGALQGIGRGLLDDLGGVDMAGEGDLVDVGVDDHGGAGGLAKAVDEINHAGREAGLDRQPADAQGGQRRLLGGLHHDGVPAGEGGAPLPGQHQEGEVPGDDLADNAHRLP